MKKPKSIRKPTGKIGAIVVSLNEESANFESLEFPTEKAEVERFVCDLFFKSFGEEGKKFYELVFSPKQNPENDFDFDLKTNSGVEALDLMEVAPLDRIKVPHKKAPFQYNHGQMADWIWVKLSEKSNNYGKGNKTKIHLLIYPTDWRFKLSPGVRKLLSFWAIKRSHCFKTIVYFAPDDPFHGEVEIIFPKREEQFKGFDEKATRNRTSLIGNPEKIKDEGNGSFSIPLGEEKPD
ncbi:MAG: hypothetical protein IIB64_08725 [Proteobacteria bacterium]|nr:hypothetical protein [Pseudomonadota bacterium]